MTDEQIKHMVNRFLCWKLPDNFNPDAGISFKAEFNEHTAHPMKHQPVGTNLLDFMQAEQMVRHIIEGMPVASTSWASPTLQRAYENIERLRADLAQPAENGIDEALRRTLDAIETADCELVGIAA